MAKQSKVAKAKRSLGRKLDSALFGITPEYRKSLGFRNPAVKRRAYRLGYESARKNPTDAGEALLAAERTVVFRESAVSDLPTLREFFLAGHQDGLADRDNPKARSAFDRCVASVAAKAARGNTGGQAAAIAKLKAQWAKDGYTVVARPERRRGAARFTVQGPRGDKSTITVSKSGKYSGSRVNPAKAKGKKNPRNPLDTAQAAYEGFHGEESKRTIVVQDKRHFHTHVWALGPLVYLKVWLPSDRRKSGLRNFVEVEFDYEGKNPVLVTANEKRNQMFFDGGDQAVDLKVFSVPPEPHETVVLGEVSDAWYFTTKKHLGNQGGTAVYKHKLGEEGGELPTLIYHTLEKRLSLAGGSYTIPNEGVRN